jgi:S-adenosylmethionine:tRNA ribosyltransferase-isomerase
MKISDFDYNLPKRLIAQSPTLPRDKCRLLVLDRTTRDIDDIIFNEIEKYLKKGDVLVFNNTMVIPARIILNIEGKKVEIFLTKKISENEWYAIGFPGKKLKPGKRFSLGDEHLDIADILDDGQRLIRFSVKEKKLEKLLKKYGSPPYPPYVKNRNIDFTEYQTVYASVKGSVAAPTAGLHFTKGLLKKLSEKGIRQEFITLHVGLGTFQPVRTDNVEDHKMHSEFYSIEKDVAERLNDAKRQGRRIIAVGTTTVRVLESSYKGRFKPFFGETDIYIYPGYKWKCVDALITNFHLPKSSLLLLVSSFEDKDLIMKAYRHAMENGYRFYSFGDAMFIL